jgi:hypothetical protein
MASGSSAKNGRIRVSSAAGLHSSSVGTADRRLRFDGVNAFFFVLGRSNVQPQFLLQLTAEESVYAMDLPAVRFHGVDKQMHLGRRVSPYVSARLTRITRCLGRHSNWRLRIESSVSIVSCTEIPTAPRNPAPTGTIDVTFPRQVGSTYVILMAFDLAHDGLPTTGPNGRQIGK